MTRRDPFRELFGYSAGLAQLFEAPGGGESGSWLPPLDVVETREAYVVVVDVPGVPSGKLDVTLESGVLTIRGERRFHCGPGDAADTPRGSAEGPRLEEPDAVFHRVERRFGQFSRSVALPSNRVDADGVVARVAEGVLTVEVPKSHTAQPRRIQVVEQAVIDADSGGGL